MSKKICLVSSQYLPHVGGVENYVFNLSRELEKQGHEVTILTSQMEGAPNYEKNGSIEVFRLPTRQFMGGRFPVLKNNKELKEFTKEFKSRHFDLMIINMRFYFLSLWACKLAKKMGVECIIIDHGSSHLNTGGKITTLMSQVFEHWITFCEKRHCKHFGGASKASLEWIKHFGIKSDVLFNNAVDVERFQGYIDNPVRSFRAELGIPENAIVVDFVGRLTVEKGVRQLINVMKRVNEERDDVYCLLAGEGYLREELEPTKSKNTIFLGKLSPAEVCAMHLASDIFCLPSFSEGFATCVIEASMCNTFVITTARGDAKELIKDDSFGIVLPTNEENGVYEALVSVLDKEEYRKSASQKCHDTVITSCTWNFTADAVIDYIEKREKERENNKK